MAKRLATEYVKACLQLTEAEMNQLVKLFADDRIMFHVKVFENGNHEIVIEDDSGKEIVLEFERKQGKYVCEGSCTLKNPLLANLMRKAIATFKGDAVVNRIYSGYKMVYYYERGCVVKIVEVNGEKQRVIYEYKNTLGELETLYRKREVEDEIQRVHARINNLLDRRNHANDPAVRQGIDQSLTKLTHRLFVLEA
jgi:hypothetical protein